MTIKTYNARKEDCYIPILNLAGVPIRHYIPYDDKGYSTDNKKTQVEIETSLPFRMGEIFLAGVIEETQQQPTPKNKKIERHKPINMNPKKIFIVHGRDNSMRKTISEYIKSLDLEPVILSKQTNKGKTVIEKIELCAGECSYAIALLSPDDYWELKNKTPLRPRARQNVILELGYMWGKLGRDKVAILYKDEVEKPSDADGIVYIPYRLGSNWREQLKKELKEAGLFEDHEAYDIDDELYNLL